MKVPLRYQNSEYDCGTTSFINALAYLYDREDIPVELLKAIYQYTLDVEDENVVIVARWLMGEEYYVIITKIDGYYAYIFDPYYLDESYYDLDYDVSLVLHETFSYNRKVSLKRLFDQTNKDFFLLKKEYREVILITK